MSDKAGKESQFMFSHPELGSDPPIGSNREPGRDIIPFRYPDGGSAQHSWASRCLGLFLSRPLNWLGRLGGWDWAQGTHTFVSFYVLLFYSS